MFLDLLRFVEVHAPDPVTAEVCRRARADEARHAHFGLAHVRHYLAHDPGHYPELLASVRRAEFMSAVTEVTLHVHEALTVLAAGGRDPDRLGEETRRVRELMAEMHDHRLRRLQAAGFTPPSRPTRCPASTPRTSCEAGPSPAGDVPRRAASG
jgi:hypothetical protein